MVNTSHSGSLERETTVNSHTGSWDRETTVNSIHPGSLDRIAPTNNPATTESLGEEKLFKDDYRDLCKEFCKICNKEFTYMYDHLLKTHKMPQNTYRKEYRDTVYTVLVHHR